MINLNLFPFYFSVSSEQLRAGHSTEYREPEKMYMWKMKKLEGGTEEQLVMKVSLMENVISRGRMIARISYTKSIISSMISITIIVYIDFSVE